MESVGHACPLVTDLKRFRTRTIVSIIVLLHNIVGIAAKPRSDVRPFDGRHSVQPAVKCREIAWVAFEELMALVRVDNSLI